MFEKNQILEIKISDQGSTGEGIGKVDGYTLFVKDTVIGDRVMVKIMKARKNYGFAKLLEIIEPSPHRVEPLCPVAKSCGGCQLQAMNYTQQLKLKQDKVYNNILRIGGLTDFKMQPIMGMWELCIPGMEEKGPFHYRNKAQFPVSVNREGRLVSGFYAGRTHSIIAIDQCPLGIRTNTKNSNDDSSPIGEKNTLDHRTLMCTKGDFDVNKVVMNTVKTFMKSENIPAYDEKNHSGLVRHVLIRIGVHTHQIMVCLIINGDKLPGADMLTENLLKIPGMTDISYNINKQKSNVIIGDKLICLHGPGYIEDYVGDVKFRISPRSFFQVNPVQTEKLYKKALEYAELTGKETVWDLYCGIGSISLFLAKQAQKVIGVEIVPDAIKDARINAKINNIENVQFLVGAAEEEVPKYFNENKNEPECSPDVIVVDPPRKGCDKKLLETMVQMNPKRIVYVSCDSATLARDLKELDEHGYKLEEVTPCDMFGQSVHVETVCKLKRV